MATNRSPLSRPTLLFYLLFFVLLLVGIYHLAEIKEITVLFARVNGWWLGAALLAQVMTYYATAKLYAELLHIYSYRDLMRPAELFKTAIIIVFLNQAIPTGGISGSSFFWRRLLKKDIPISQSLSIVMLQDVTYYSAHLSMLIGSFIGFIAFGLGYPSALMQAIGMLGVGIYLVFVMVVVGLGGKKAVAFISRKLNDWTFINRLLQRFGIEVQELLRGKEDWHSPWLLMKEHRYHLTWPLIWQLAVIAADAFTMYALFHGFGLSIHYLTALLAFTLTMVISTISVSPGALAFFEGASTLFYASLGVPLHAALVVTLMFRALSFWLPMPIGLWLYKRMPQEA